jgi:hypothetical protein
MLKIKVEKKDYISLTDEIFSISDLLKIKNVLKKIYNINFKYGKFAIFKTIRFNGLKKEKILCK